MPWWCRYLRIAHSGLSSSTFGNFYKVASKVRLSRCSSQLMLKRCKLTEMLGPGFKCQLLITVINNGLKVPARAFFLRIVQYIYSIPQDINNFIFLVF